MAHTNSSYTYGSAFYSTANFLIENIPAKEEVVTVVSISAFVKALVAPFSPTLKGLIDHPNPTVSSFVRDIIKVPSGFISSYYAHPVGGTRYINDNFLLAGTIIKPLCKLSIIYYMSPVLLAASSSTTTPFVIKEFLRAAGVTTELINLQDTKESEKTDEQRLEEDEAKKDVEKNADKLSSTISNYICEAPSSFLKSISRDIQDRELAEGKHLSISEKFEVFLEHITISDLFEAFASGITKTTMTELMGAKYGNLITKKALNEAGKVINKHLVDVAIQQYFPVPTSAAFATIHNFFSLFAKGVVDTYVLATAGRIGSEIPRLVSKIPTLVSQSIYGNENQKDTSLSPKDYSATCSHEEQDFCPASSSTEVVGNFNVCLAGEEQPVPVI